eukprot:CAMPEP_0183736128 /NCGR_PEP_ID=MMETSP0737-20130205/48548_1 /TAXON_ID=385413 /ORGANISM="Thalassiosira miniscula, Strain CCMP1093" /LENGTH=562 /DNA_ID=CAMNT_0025970059 /DNA_START=135 /DNA_END=1823 /DNA_ORIENTATION=-
MVRIDDATPEGISDYIASAARELVRETHADALMNALMGRLPCELDELEDVPLDGWWGDATPEDPRIAYERFIDACRLFVEETGKRDGRLFAYFGYEPDRTTNCMWLKNFANCLRSAKYQKLMPHWWNPQHEIAMFRYGAKEDSDFYILNTRKVGDAIEVWGAPTARTITALAARLENKLRKQHDEVSDAIAEVFREAHSDDPEDIGIIPTREKGFGQGEGIPCRYGVGCKRRDCWFMHPKLELPTGDLVRKDNNEVVYSQYIVDHCIEMANGKENLIKLIDYYQLSMVTNKFDVRQAVIDPRNRYTPLSKYDTEKFIQGEAEKGNSMAQYLWSKMLGDPSFNCLRKNSKYRYSKMIEFLTASALAGNALSRMGLAKLNLDGGYLPVAIHWYMKALASASFPEAAYFIGVAYGKEEYPEAGVPIQYNEAANYYLYSYALGLSLPKLDPLSADFDPDDMDFSLMYSLMTLGPSNELQQEYQRLSIHNLYIVKRYLAFPHLAPVKDTKVAPLPVESTETCALCHRRPNVGEEELVGCKRCGEVKYCNKICQRGHWTEGHKDECQA